MAQVCGYLALSMPFLGNRYAENNHTSRLEVDDKCKFTFHIKSFI